jgi:hypothetical protein
MLRCAATSCCLGDSPGAVPNCVSWRLTDNRSLPCDDPPSLSRYEASGYPSGASFDGEHNAVLYRPCRCSKERQHRAPRSGCIPHAQLLCDVGELQYTTGTFLVLLVYGPRSIGVIRAHTEWVFREEAVAASPLEGAKLSSLPTSSSCDKGGRHNLHNCTLTSALGIVIDIIVALATL